MNEIRKMWLCIWLWCTFASINADDQNTTTTAAWNSSTTTAWNSTTTNTPLAMINTTSESVNWPTTVTPSSSEQSENDTEISNFIGGIDYNANVTTGNSTYLEHFTKFNWTVLDTFDNTFGGTDDVSVKDDAENATDHVPSSRVGHERNLMVVLPVMQGNSDLSNSNLQVLYTKSPVTAIIGERKEERKPQESSPRTTVKIVQNRVKSTEAPVNNLERIDHVPEQSPSQDIKRYMLNKPPSKPKSPLDYGYPETFKFIEDFNELPKNHRPDWAVPDTATTAAPKKSSSVGVTRRDPFQMFESVKPLEINKLLSFKPIPVTDSIIEQSPHGKKKHQFSNFPTESNSRPVTKRPQKRPGKKPQKNKTTVLTKFVAQYVPEYTSPEPAIPSPSVEDLYTAAQYTTLLSRTTSGFLPTPYKEPMVNERTVKTTTPRFMPEEPSSTVSMMPETTREEVQTTPPTTSTVSTTITTTTEATTTTSTTTTATPTTTPIASTTNVTAMIMNITSTFYPTTECSLPDHKKHQIKPSDLINLKKILGEEFGVWSKPSTESIKTKDTANTPFSGDMLTSDMKNMLIALGVLKPDGHMEERITTTTTTTTNNYLEEMFGRRDPVKPTIDPHSYSSFKKIPIDFAKPIDKLAVSDEMKDLLASFGLLPKNPYANLLSRMTRQHKMISDTNSASSSTEGISSTTPLTNDNTAEPIESLDTLTPQPFNYQPHENGHVFHPTVHLEKLGDERKLRTINHVIDSIKKLSKSGNASEAEVRQHLENITSLIKNDNSKDRITGTINRTESESGTRTTIDLNTNSDFNFNSDESSIINTLSDPHNVTDLTKAQDAPNPLSSDELQQLFESNKNEVKRQQPANATGNAPLSDLAASFGGGETASEAPVAEDVPTAKPNGLYFFVDWNTFLNVGESEKNAVKLRFAPRAGNPRNFVPITVP